MESASSFSTSRSEVVCEVEPKCGGADRSLSFKSGRSGSKIGPYSQLRGQFSGRRPSGDSRRADRRGRSMCGVSCRCYGAALLWGNGFGSLRKSYKSPTTERSRGRHPRLRPLKRACWFDIIMVGSPRTGRMRRMMLPLSKIGRASCRERV